jgi:branched-chain amino acid aminotransferase
MVTRGVKRTVNQDPRLILGGATIPPPAYIRLRGRKQAQAIVIVAEYTVVNPEAKARGLTLFTSTFRTSGPDVFDLRLNSHRRLNLIQALTQAINAGAAEAIVLRVFVRPPARLRRQLHLHELPHRATSELWTSIPPPAYIPRRGRTLPLRSGSHDAFVTGTLGGVTPAVRIDGRQIGTGTPGPVTSRASDLSLAAVMP